MERQLDRMAKAATQQEFREGGYGFHLELTRATRNPLLVSIFERIVEARARAGWGRLAALNATPAQRAAQIARKPPDARYASPTRHSGGERSVARSPRDDVGRDRARPARLSAQRQPIFRRSGWWALQGLNL